MNVRALAIAAALLLVLGRVAAGHAYLKTATPAEDSTVRGSPKEVRLVFTESVETRFSIFKVYPLPAAATSDLRRLNASGGALVSRVLQKKDDGDDRVDDGLATTARTTREVVLRLKEGLKAGAYVVMYRVLSVDAHTTQGFYVFVLASP
jgi:methionine-rich copper-binding protein CopC